MPFLVDIRGSKNFSACEAGDQPVCAVQLDQPRVGCAGELMQAVDVLCDQTEQLTALFEVTDCLVADVGLDRLEELVGGFLELPMLDPCRCAGEKILE